MNGIDVWLSAVVVKSDRLHESNGGREVFLLNERKGKYYGLGAIGSRIWMLLDEPREVAAVCGELVAEFDVERVALEADVLSFLRHLLKEGLIEIVNAADLKTEGAR